MNKFIPQSSPNCDVIEKVGNVSDKLCILCEEYREWSKGINSIVNKGFNIKEA
jgi:hypothetical protein